MDTIFVKDLAITGKHGVMGHEWSHEQSFLVDMVVWFDTRKSSQSDKLSDSINYAHLCTIAKDVIEGQSVYLIETLASLIVEGILKDSRIEKVKVAIRKPSVLPSGVPGVSIVRKQKF